MNDPAQALPLNAREGLPDDLCFLLKKYPREDWRTHKNLGQMADFWLQRHDMFRELGGMLNDANSHFREGKIGADQYQSFFVPRLQFFLQQLNAHHQIEDHHYFPIFQAAESKLAHGFELLDADHHILHENIVTVVEKANAFLQELQNNAEPKKVMEGYAGSAEILIANMLNHLRDEEDLIVPLILDRGEQALGVAHY